MIDSVMIRFRVSVYNPNHEPCLLVNQVPQPTLLQFRKVLDFQNESNKRCNIYTHNHFPSQPFPYLSNSPLTPCRRHHSKPKSPKQHRSYMDSQGPPARLPEFCTTAEESRRGRRLEIHNANRHTTSLITFVRPLGFQSITRTFLQESATQPM
uniref:Uncharacterized protein n=1 Tax=Helianthus annuus TaxID=4232 RepID=A0A251U9T6_HELAN